MKKSMFRSASCLRPAFRANSSQSTASNVYIRLRNFTIGTSVIAALTVGGFYYTDSRSAMHRYLIIPVLRNVLSAEDAHRFAIDAMKAGIAPWDKIEDDERLRVRLFGKEFDNPVGVAAGLDKDGEAVDPLFHLGFSYVEIGTVTPLPQPGNPKPRYFRLKADRASINRYGFNSVGAAAVAQNLRSRLRAFVSNEYPSLMFMLSEHPTSALVADNLGFPRSLRRGRVLGVNIGKNRAGDEILDYTTGVRALGPYADLLVVNVSSPNTPGLRQLQRKAALTRLLKAVVEERDTLRPRPPVCVKLAPDLSDSEIVDVAQAVTDARIDGVILGNTTTSRPPALKSSPELVGEAGGLSGPPVREGSLATLRKLAPLLPKHIGVIGCGGITSGKDAVEYARAGAGLVQVYTEFVYDGPGCARRIKDEILDELGTQKWEDIVGRSA